MADLVSRISDLAIAIAGQIKTLSNSLTSHVANTANPHGVTKAQVGLGAVDNTSDADKPPSTAVASALAGKQAALGFTPVQQGTGASQTSNTVKIGWSAGGSLRVQVDDSDFGATWPVSVSGAAARLSDGAYTEGAFRAAAGLMIGAGKALVYADGEQVAARSGASGSEKYFRFGADGTFYALNGGLNAAGDITTTGGLTINRAWPSAVLNKPASGTSCQIVADTNGVVRWVIYPGDSAAETGSNAGSNFSIDRFNDAGSWLGSIIGAIRASGNITFNGGGGSSTFTNDLTVGGVLYGNNGLRYTHAIRLPSGTDFNNVLAAGFYDCDSPVNAPASTWGWLEVQSHSLDANNWVLQRWTRFFTPGPATTWQRRKVGGVWGVWYPLTGYVTPEHYGAAGDGSTDDTAAVTAALNSGFPVRLVSPYKISSAISISLASREGINVTGVGSNSRLLLTTTTARLEINNVNPDNPVGTEIDQVVLRDFTLAPALATAVNVLSVLCASGDAGSSAPGVVIENVNVIPTSTANGSTGIQIRLHNVRNARISGCDVFGQYFQYAGSGFRITSDAGSNPVEVDFKNCTASHLTTAFRFDPAGGTTGYDDWEGVSLVSCRGIAVDYGVYAVAGSEYYNGWLTVASCHFNFRATGIYLGGVRYPKVHDNYLLCGFDGPSLQMGIYQTAGGGVSPYGSISDNDISFEGRTATTRYGVRSVVASGETSVLKTKIHHNQVISATSAYALDASTISDNNSSV